MRALFSSLLALSFAACSYGVLPPPEGDPAAAPPPAASKPPLGDAVAPPTAPAPPPRNNEAGCPGVDAQGNCRGSVAIWCEGGQLRTVDCASINRACEFVDEATGYYCGSPTGGAQPAPPQGDPEENPEENPGDPPAEGAPPPPAPGPGEGAPPPEGDPGAPNPPDPQGDPDEDPGAPPAPPGGGGAPPPAAPPPAEGAPAPPNEGAPSPPAGQAPADPCGGVTYLGTCEGDIAVWCDGQQVRRDDCRVNGLTCGYIDEETGYYCREGQAPGAPAPPAPDPAEPAPAPPEQGAPPPPEGCGDIDFYGECAGDVVVYCHNGDLVRYDCAPSGTTCGWASDEIGNWCVEL